MSVLRGKVLFVVHHVRIGIELVQDWDVLE
jgi:hypothetical protein